MRARLVDVAKLAGVSPKTVSNVVNGYVHVSPQMRERVRAAIRELNYVPNSTARQLRTGRTGVIALALPDLSVPYFAELAKYVTAEAAERSYTILIDQTEGLEDRERHLASSLDNNVIEGVIFSPLAMRPRQIAETFASAPLVLLGEREYPATADHVAVDNVAAAMDATRHLLAIGRRRIAAVGLPVDRRAQTGALRREGYLRALAEAGQDLDPALVVPTEEYHRRDGVEAMERLLALPDPPEAVFCFNDLLAIGALHALRARGLRVPDDIAVIGFDDIEEGQFSNPTLTTIAPNKETIARTAVDLLCQTLSQIHQPDSDHQLDGHRQREPADVVVEHRLVPRESTLGTAAA